MPALTEIDALKAIDNALAQLQDQAARDRVLKWACAKYSTQPAPTPSRPTQRRKAKKKKPPTFTPSLVKDLELRPEGKKSFNDFASEKKPTTNQQKCTVAVYYLSRVLNTSGISTDHVFTCFKQMNWRKPSDLYNTLVFTAHDKGWLDTSDMTNIRLTPLGENLVEHDLPRKKSARGDS